MKITPLWRVHFRGKTEAGETQHFFNELAAIQYFIRKYEALDEYKIERTWKNNDEIKDAYRIVDYRLGVKKTIKGPANIYKIISFLAKQSAERD